MRVTGKLIRKKVVVLESRMAAFFYYIKTKGWNKMDIMQTGTVLAIVVITYLIGAAAKLIPHIKDEYIPVIVGVAGGALGAAGISSRPV